jgi:hypothetical protein
MVDIGGRFVGNWYGHFVNDGSAMAQYVGFLALPYGPPSTSLKITERDSDIWQMVNPIYFWIEQTFNYCMGQTLVILCRGVKMDGLDEFGLNC